MKRILLVTIAILVLMPCQGRDEYRYRNITMNDGLAANTVRNIVQDPYGFIWLGTDNGLCRYDGTQVQTYRIAELGMNQYISSLLTAEDAIYVGTEKGVFQLKQASQQFTRLPMDISSAVIAVQPVRHIHAGNFVHHRFRQCRIAVHRDPAASDNFRGGIVTEGDAAPYCFLSGGKSIILKNKGLMELRLSLCGCNMQRYREHHKDE